MNEEEITSGLTDNERERIRDVLDGTYTPLIDAIIHQDIDAIKDLLENGADPNETDSELHWCPLKWADFVYTCNKGSHDTLSIIVEALYNSGAKECFDNTLRDGTYNFSPIILEVDEKKEQLLREIEEEEEEEGTILGGKRRRKRKTLRRKKMTGGRRRKKSRKSRKHKKAKKSTTKRR